MSVFSWYTILVRLGLVLRIKVRNLNSRRPRTSLGILKKDSFINGQDSFFILSLGVKSISWFIIKLTELDNMLIISKPMVFDETLGMLVLHDFLITQISCNFELGVGHGNHENLRKVSFELCNCHVAASQHSLSLLTRFCFFAV